MFGPVAVFGNVQLPAAKLKALKTLKNVAAAWDSKNAAAVQAEWAEKNPDAEELIQWSIVVAQSLGLTDPDTN